MKFDLGRHSIARWAESASDGDVGDFTPAEERFSVETPIGRGGMGEVFLVHDQDLRRQVAMKILRRETGVGRDQLLHFVAEAQATSQLEHPGIPPVHDIGLTADGRPYFTMKLVRGRTLREILRDLVLKRREVQREYSLHRLVTVLERIAEALQFAHERGVIHRDLKPENIMLGDYGEVHLMDWGLARVEGESAEYEQVLTARVDSGLETQHGSVKGTLAYMSPEQASGMAVDARTDVYALGCVLYEVLTLQPAFDPLDEKLPNRVLAADFAPVEERNPRRAVPAPLAAICRKAMARERDERYATAAGLRDDFRAWLDGRADRERRHAEAERLAAQGKEAATRYGRLKREIEEAEAAADAEAAKYKPWQPVREKQAAVAARRRATEIETEIALAFGESTHLLGAALTQEPDNKTARRALAALWRGRLDEAERRRDAVGTAAALAAVERYSDEPPAAGGTLVLRSDPAGATVEVFRYEEEDGVLVARPHARPGSTPLAALALPMGSYVCVIAKEGYRDTRFPVHITRDCEWQGDVALRTDDEIGDGLVYVPGGPFVFGDEKGGETRHVPDFAIARFPVTNAEYVEFLESLDDEEAHARRPHTESSTFLERGEDGKWRPARGACSTKGRARFSASATARTSSGGYPWSASTSTTPLRIASGRRARPAASGACRPRRSARRRRAASTAARSRGATWRIRASGSAATRARRACARSRSGRSRRPRRRTAWATRRATSTSGPTRGSTSSACSGCCAAAGAATPCTCSGARCAAATVRRPDTAWSASAARAACRGRSREGAEAPASVGWRAGGWHNS